MPSSYPVAYRNTSGERHSQPRKAKPLTPSGLSRTAGRMPPAANANVPTAGRSALRKALRPLVPLGRMVPYLGTALLLYDLYEIWKYSEYEPEIPGDPGDPGGYPTQQAYQDAGWTQLSECFDDFNILNSWGGSNTCNFWATATLATWNAGLGQGFISGTGSTRRSNYRYYHDVRVQPGVPGNRQARYSQQWYKYHTTGALLPEPVAPAIPPTDPVPERQAVYSGANHYVVEAPSIVRTYAPQTMPVGQFIPPPANVPYWMLPHLRPNLWEVPSQRRVVSNRVPRPTDNPDYPIASEPAPNQIPVVAPTVVIGTSPLPKPAPLPLHALAPARKGEKERKVRVTYGIAGFAMNAVTETGDFVESLYWALPRDKRAKYPGTSVTIRNPTLVQMLRAVAANWENLDISTALGNLLQNEIEDRLIGKLARGVAKHSYTAGMVRSPLQGPAL